MYRVSHQIIYEYAVKVEIYYSQWEWGSGGADG